MKKDSAPAMPSGTAYLIGRLHRLVRLRLAESISPLGLTVQQYTVLAVLGARGQLSNAQLAERSFVTPQTANEMVKAMEDRGWIERSADPSHGRIIHLRLTPDGQEVLSRAHAAAARFETGLLAELAPRDRERFLDYLKTCVNALSLTSIHSGD